MQSVQQLFLCNVKRAIATPTMISKTHVKNNHESIGVLFTLTSALLWGIFPILVNAWSGVFPPLFFGAIISLCTAAGSIVWMIARGKTHELRNTKSYFSLFMVSMCIVCIPSILFFVGTSQTSGINSSVLMLSEIVFTLMFTPFFGEKNTIQKYIGSLGILFGGALVLYKGGGLQLNTGDILILLSTITFPIGNFYSKRALYYVSPSVVLSVRYTVGGLGILMASLLVEPQVHAWQSVGAYLPFFILVGVLLLTTCKVTFYEGMKRLDISKVISLEMTYPFFSVIALYFIFDQHISWYQLAGICIMVLGAFYSMKRKSETHNELKYKPKAMRNI